MAGEPSTDTSKLVGPHEAQEEVSLPVLIQGLGFPLDSSSHLRTKVLERPVVHSFLPVTEIRGDSLTCATPNSVSGAVGKVVRKLVPSLEL